jgi:hypothetical protein
LKELHIEPKIDANKLKLKYDHMHKTEYENEGEEESKEESKAEEEELRPISVSVTICKKEDRKYCVDFRFKEGDKEAFIEHYQDLLHKENDRLYAYHNAKKE